MINISRTMNSWRKLLLCTILCLAWILYPLTAVHAQDETPPPPTPEATETTDPVESTPDTVVLIVTDAAPTSTSEAETSPTPVPEGTEQASPSVETTSVASTVTETADSPVESTLDAPTGTETTAAPVDSTPDAFIVVVATDVPSQEVAPDAANAVETTTSLLVQFDAGASQDELMQSLSQYGLVNQTDLSQIHYVLLSVAQNQYESAMTGLSSLPGVMLVEANGELHLEDTIPNDPDFSSQYGLTAIHAPQAWDTTTGSSAVTIAIVDTGVDLTHPDLASRLLSGYDFVNNDADPMDDNGHGTHVAGIAAALTNNSSGVAGVTWQTQILPVKVLNAGGNGAFDNVAQGIIYAVDNGAQVINLSLGGAVNSSVLQSAINYAYSHGVVVVAATGNANTSVFYPAAYPQVIAVAASDESNNRASFSNYGPEVDVTAPGVNIRSTALGGGYETRSGTSMAAAYVTGEVALIYSVNSDLTPDEIAHIIKSTALDIDAPGVDDNTGSGLIQLDAALASVPAMTTQQPPVVVKAPRTTRNASQSPGAPLPPPTSSGPTLPMPTLPAGTPTEAELSAQAAIQTPTPEIVSTLEAPATAASSSNLGLAYEIAILFVIIGAAIFFSSRKKTTKS